jgi:hypothetical protein
MERKQWVGLDVFGKKLEVFVRPIQRILKVANSPAGLATLVSELLAIDPALILIEATANWHLGNRRSSKRYGTSRSGDQPAPGA